MFLLTHVTLAYHGPPLKPFSTNNRLKRDISGVKASRGLMEFYSRLSVFQREFLPCLRALKDSRHEGLKECGTGDISTTCRAAPKRVLGWGHKCAPSYPSSPLHLRGQRAKGGCPTEDRVVWINRISVSDIVGRRGTPMLTVRLAGTPCSARGIFSQAGSFVTWLGGKP